MLKGLFPTKFKTGRMKMYSLGSKCFLSYPKRAWCTKKQEGGDKYLLCKNGRKKSTKCNHSPVILIFLKLRCVLYAQTYHCPSHCHPPGSHHATTAAPTPPLHKHKEKIKGGRRAHHLHLQIS